MSEHAIDEAYYRGLSLHYPIQDDRALWHPDVPAGGRQRRENPESNWPLSTVTILVNFEGPYSRFRTWTPSEWVDDYPARRFAHLVHRTASQRVTTACKRSRNRRGGWIYVTNDILPNPWNKAPYAPFLACPTLNRPLELKP